MRSLGVLFIGVLVAVGAFLGPLAGVHAFTTDEVKAAIQEHIAQKVKEGGGVFRFKDEMTGKDLALEFVKIRIVRKIEGHGYFADVDFRVRGEPEKFYDIDFWVRPEGDKLIFVDARMHKYPKKEGNEWVLTTVTPLPWWWAVAQEHPGETADAKAWQVKAAIHTHIAEKLKEGRGVYRLKDEKTGQELALEFVKIHDPVTKTKEGYFACTDFRVKGEPGKLYDLDFWLNQKGDTLVVTQTRLHKEPAKEGAKWMKKPRYNFGVDGMPVEIQ